MVVKYKSEISLIGLVNWVLGLEKGTIWIVPFFSFMEFLFPGTYSRYCVLASRSKSFIGKFNVICHAQFPGNRKQLHFSTKRRREIRSKFILAQF